MTLVNMARSMTHRRDTAEACTVDGRGQLYMRVNSPKELPGPYSSTSQEGRLKQALEPGSDDVPA